MSIQLQRALPRQIIFCIDVSGEMNEMLYPSIDGGVNQQLTEPRSRLDTVIYQIKRYISMNRVLAPNDTYGFIGMMEKAYWIMGFTSDSNIIHKSLESLSIQEYCSTFDTTSLFKTIHDKAIIKVQEENNRFIHAMIFYGRTNVMPDSIHTQYDWMRNHSNFTFDLLFLHGPPKETDCQTVYDYWIDLEPNVSSWFFEFGKLGQSQLTRVMAQLTAHPLQRGDQERIIDVFTLKNQQDEQNPLYNQETETICLSD
ncbi:hypothetical protein BDC45DRAFT_335915 [Circinella umbellata]|nr:hypothetical protein BDC45DRAFT_335915 [Circinella umbellata]